MNTSRGKYTRGLRGAVVCRLARVRPNYSPLSVAENFPDTDYRADVNISGIETIEDILRDVAARDDREEGDHMR